MTKKSVWERSEDDAKQISDKIIEQIKAGVAPWRKPWKPREALLRPITFDLHFYIGRGARPEAKSHG